MTNNIIEHGFCSRNENRTKFNNAPFNPFVVMQQCFELVGAMIPIIKWCASQNMLRAEVEQWVLTPTIKKDDNIKTRIRKGEREENTRNKEEEWITPNKTIETQ